MDHGTFDNLTLAQRLHQKGLPQEQAKTIADELEMVSTKKNSIPIKYMLFGFLVVIIFQIAVLFVCNEQIELLISLVKALT